MIDVLHRIEAKPGPYAHNPLTLYARLVLIRRFEERVATLFAENRLPGDVHLSIGQEAVAVGVCAHLEADDYAAGSHRSHGIALAKGVPLAPLMAELMGRRGGLCGGKGGSMHIAYREAGFLGAFPVVGSAAPLLAGAALSAQQRGSGQVAVVFIGDGALNQGLTMEAFNLAAVWELPLLIVLENNRWAETTPVADAFRIEPLARRAEAFGIPAETIDGQDLPAVLAAAKTAIDRARSGEGPAFLECLTERFRGHYEGDPGGYRSASEEEAIRARDPLPAYAPLLELAPEDLAQIVATVDETLDRAINEAEAQLEPDLNQLVHQVFVEEP